MRKLLKVFIILNLIIMSVDSWSQEKSDAKITLSKKTFGFQVGTAHFQNVRLNLFNFDQELLTSSDDLVPVDLKVNFAYYFTPSVAVKFASGYGFSEQKNVNEIDYGKIDMQNLKLTDSATFSATGFPTEIALIFKTPFDARANLFFHFGVGFGYYVYNYQAEGKFRQLMSKTAEKIIEEEYVNPQVSLSGGAQFFIMGLEMNINSRVSASLEVSKIGWSLMTLTQDILKQDIEAGEITNEKKYGFSRQDYSVKNGFEDIAVSLGLNWNL